uniref:Translocase of outer mitochondrial membrane 5 homolog (yeast) n=1 Tax=Amphiprion ocellaris TaxID=80972 RepID=A0AAQ5Z1M1_AMPOC
MFKLEGLGPKMDPEEMKKKMRQDVISSLRNFLIYVALLRASECSQMTLTFSHFTTRFFQFSSVCVKEAGQHMSGAAGLFFLHPLRVHCIRDGMDLHPADSRGHHSVTVENDQCLSTAAALEKPACSYFQFCLML